MATEIELHMTQAGKFAAAFILGLMLLLLTVTLALAHEWYSVACCKQRDCRRIDRAQIRETPEGYRLFTGETIAYGDRRIKRSEDSDFHWCECNGSTCTSPTRCLYTPGAGA